MRAEGYQEESDQAAPVSVAEVQMSHPEFEGQLEAARAGQEECLGRGGLRGGSQSQDPGAQAELQESHWLWVALDLQFTMC